LGLTQQKTPLTAVILLLYDITVGVDIIENTVPSGTSIAYVPRLDMFDCCVAIYHAIA
jgi:hypothetical protein